MGGLSPRQFSLFPQELLAPEATHGVHRRNVPHPGRGRGSTDGGEQRPPILANHESRRLACVRAIREPIIFDAVFVALSPALLHVLREPLRGCNGQHILRRPNGFLYSLDAIEQPDLRQHMRRVTALASACFDRASFPLPRQQQINDSQSLVPSQQALPKLDQHTGIKTRTSEFQPHQIFPIQASTSGIGCLSIREVL